MNSALTSKFRLGQRLQKWRSQGAPQWTAVLSAVLVAFGSSSLHLPSIASARSCRQIFAKDSLAFDTIEFRNSTRILNEKWREAEVALAFGDRPLPPIEAALLNAAANLFELSGTKFRRTNYLGENAIEILSEAKSTNQWNKMAAAIEKNYSTRLIFSPLHLIRRSAEAAFVQATSVNSRSALLISRGSLSLGTRESAVLHEARHMSMSARQLKTPTIFDGWIHARDPELSAIQPAAIWYRSSMGFQEIATHAQDLSNTARNLRNSETLARSELNTKAKVALEVVANAKVAQAKLEEVFRDLLRQIDDFGPAIASSGTDSPALYIFKKDTLDKNSREKLSALITLESSSNQTWTLQIQTESLVVDLILPPKKNSNWDRLVELAANGNTRSRDELVVELQKEIRNWSSKIDRATGALERPAKIIARDAGTLPVDQLLQIASEARHELGPHLQRTP